MQFILIHPGLATGHRDASSACAPIHGSIFLAGGPCAFHAFSSSRPESSSSLHLHSVVIRNRLLTNSRRGDRRVPAATPHYSSGAIYILKYLDLSLIHI